MERHNLSKKKFIEEVLENINIGEEDLRDLERVREETWRTEKKRIMKN